MCELHIALLSLSPPLHHVHAAVAVPRWTTLQQLLLLLPLLGLQLPRRPPLRLRLRPHHQQHRVASV